LWLRIKFRFLGARLRDEQLVGGGLIRE